MNGKEYYPAGQHNIDNIPIDDADEQQPAKPNAIIDFITEGWKKELGKQELATGRLSAEHADLCSGCAMCEA